MGAQNHQYLIHSLIAFKVNIVVSDISSDMAGGQDGDEAAQAMAFMEVDAETMSYVNLHCGDHHCQVKEADNWLEVEGEAFVRLDVSIRCVAAFILNCTDLRSFKTADRLADLVGLHELKELRNTWKSSKPSLFDTPKKHARVAQKDRPDWPSAISIDVKLDGWPEIRMLNRNVRDNEYLWVCKEDLGVVMSYIQSKGLSGSLKRVRHELPNGIQKRKLKSDPTKFVYVVSNKTNDITKYTQFQSIEAAMEFQQKSFDE